MLPTVRHASAAYQLLVTRLVTRVRDADGFGAGQAVRFGVINLRAPGAICPSCTGIAGQWHPQLTYTDFVFEIIHQP